MRGRRQSRERATLALPGAQAIDDLDMAGTIEMSALSLLRPGWPAPPSVQALSTLRAGGVSLGAFAALNLGDHVGDEAAHVRENRRRLRQDVRLPDEPRWLRQVHGARVVDLDTPDADLTADAAVTRRRGVVCAILTADCLPVLFTDVQGDCIAAAHAGWRGLAAGVLEATVAAMAVPPSKLMAWIGPGIGPRHFEVGPEVREALIAANGAAREVADSAAIAPGRAACFVRQGEKFLADLPMLAHRRLAALGVGRIDAVDACTYSDPQRFFSHRRDGRCGRHATLIWKM